MTVGMLAVGTALSACGGPSRQGSSTDNARTQGTGLVAYSSCMRSHGVPNFPDPGGKGGIPKESVVSAFREVSNAQVQAAQSACSHLLPPGGSLSGRATQTITAQDQKDYLKAAACMRSHGVADFPDPTFSDGHVSINIPPSIDTHSTQFTQAAQICTKLIPSGLPYSSGSGG